jgi:hypothetical protein
MMRCAYQPLRFPLRITAVLYGVLSATALSEEGVTLYVLECNQSACCNVT